MNSNNKMIINGQMVAGVGGLLSLLDQTSRMLANADTAEDFADAREYGEALRTLARKLKANNKILFEAACLTIRAEHALGLELARMTIVQGSPGNQWTGKLDRLPRVTGPICLEDIGITKRISHRARQISKIPMERLEQWMAEQCNKGKEPTLRGAYRLAKSLESSDSNTKPNKPGKGKKKNRKQPSKQSSYDDCQPNPPGSPLASLHDAMKHLKIVGEQLEPIYKEPPRLLSETELHTLQKFLQQACDSLTKLESYHRKEANPYSPYAPHGGQSLRK